MDTFTVNYTEIVAHAHAVDTRPSLSSPSRRPGDEATTAIDPSVVLSDLHVKCIKLCLGVYMYMYYYIIGFLKFIPIIPCQDSLL